MKSPLAASHIERYITIGFIALGLLLFYGAIVTYQNGQRIIHTGQSLTNAHLALYQIESFKKEASEIERFNRAYIITGNPEFSTITAAVTDSVVGREGSLRLLLADKPLQLARLDSLHKLEQFVSSENRHIRQLIKEGKQKEAIQSIEAEETSNLSHQIHSLADAMKADQLAELALMQKTFDKGQNLFLLAYVLRSIFIPGVLLLVYLVIRYYLRMLKKTETQLRENIAEVEDKKETIGKINEELHKKIKELGDYKYALDESSVVAITDRDGIITHANDNFCKISGYPRQELIGQDHRIINPGYHTKEFMAGLWQTITSGNIWRGEVKNRAKDGSYFWMDTVIVPFLDEQRKPYQYLALRTDITHRKEAEEQLEQRSMQLEVANKELESFSYSVSHDLRAPVRAIHGYTQILKADYGQQLNKDASEVMDIIIQNAKKMGMLIDDLLRFSRLSRQELQRNMVSMNEVVADVCKELKAMQHHPVEYHIKNLHGVIADRVIIKQVWVNLISNAIKYSCLKEKGIIEIGSEETDTEIIYYVKDNGAGFDMRYYDKLFGVFQRLHTEEEFDGTGVGLAIVQRIIVKHGGRVWAESTVDEGATFYFSLNKL